MIIDRLAGLAMAALGLVLLYAVIPDQVETVDYGWVRPKTLPNALAVALIALGLVQAALAGRGAAAVGEDDDDDPGGRGGAPRAALYLAVAGLGVWAMGRVGFPWAAPPLVLVLMLLVGERRPHWMVVAAVAVPAVIWLVVEVLLGRPLPGG